ncbi:hypothetical protein CABS02_14611 [Colletotrichum abscissum]|uniref:Uncharacterized protein n=1 Tax=Colletotrichum abscissum TaxID=1671311 RepID=A0A9Q0ATC6_9PEZI|nr:hypothetical protein CABS02_14611 [Colletotrichum abscissum]
MASPSNFWTLMLKADFHGTIASLQQLTNIPSEPRAYREGATPQAHTNVLSIEDEIQMTNSIAFLAHRNEGAKFVSTVTLREYPDRLQVVLAGNTTPSSGARHELANIMTHLGKLSRRERIKHALREELLDMVLLFSSSRILSRLRPPWMAQPRHFKAPQLSLQDRLRSCMLGIRDTSQSSTHITSLLKRLKDLVNTLKLVQQHTEVNASLSVLKMIVISCVEVARLGSTTSVEEHLKSLDVQTRFAESPEIRQVDKLARYFFTCNDLARLARKPSYRHMFSNIEVMALEAPLGFRRPGIAQYCFVHAEIQQIFHLEQQPHTPAPRAIGCSKSACYLCDLFVRTHGTYVVSHSHGRLYEKWTLPDVDWMNATQADRFQSMVQSMVKDMREAIRRLKGGVKTIYRYPLESRACLPLSSEATSSLAERHVETEENALPIRPDDGMSAILTKCHSWPVMLSPFVQITKLDLPWHRFTRLGQEPLHVQIDRLSLHIEFASTATGLLSVYSRQSVPREASKMLKADDIPVNSDLPIQGSRASRKVALGISLDATVAIQIEFEWDTPEY